jgi:exosortase A-associated hydrolase 2
MKAIFRNGPQPYGGRRFVVVHEPHGVVRGLIVGVPPFAEEHNKSRRTCAIAARAMAKAGYLVVQVDPAGCGDSSGDLVSASWAAWIEDVIDTVAWARELASGVPLLLWGTRAGCLLASEVCDRLGDGHLLFWQPQASGKLVLQQFLRLKMAGQLKQGAAKGLTDALMQELAQGRAVDIAGYALGPALALGLAAAQLRKPKAGQGTQVVWLEATTQDPPELLPVSQGIVQRWQESGCTVRAAALNAPQFWQSLGIEEAYALVERSVAEIEEVSSSCIPALV